MLIYLPIYFDEDVINIHLYIVHVCIMCSSEIVWCIHVYWQYLVGHFSMSLCILKGRGIVMSNLKQKSLDIPVVWFGQIWYKMIKWTAGNFKYYDILNAYAVVKQ